MKQNFLTKTWVVAMLAFLCCLLWGSAIPTIKTGYRLMGIDASDTAAQIIFAGFRFMLAGFLVIMFACIRSRNVILPGRKLLKLAFPLCLAQTAGQYLFFYIGVAHTSGVKSSIINGLGNFIAIMMSCLIFRREKLEKNKLAGCILGFAGVVVINLAGNSLDAGFRFIGEGSLFAAQIAYALSTVLIHIFSKKESPVILSGYQFMLGGLLLLAAGLGMGGGLKHISAGALLILLYLALVSAVAYTLWSVLLAHNPVSKVAIYGFANPLFSVILSALVLGETAQAFHMGSLLALALVCIGIYMVNRQQEKK